MTRWFQLFFSIHLIKIEYHQDNSVFFSFASLKCHPQIHPDITPELKTSTETLTMGMFVSLLMESGRNRSEAIKWPNLKKLRLKTYRAEVIKFWTNFIYVLGQPTDDLTKVLISTRGETELEADLTSNLKSCFPTVRDLHYKRYPYISEQIDVPHELICQIYTSKNQVDLDYVQNYIIYWVAKNNEGRKKTSVVICPNRFVLIWWMLEHCFLGARPSHLRWFPIAPMCTIAPREVLW